MSVLFVILPLAMLFAAVAVTAFIVAVRRGQFDELDSPPWRMLFDDAPRAREPVDTQPPRQPS